METADTHSSEDSLAPDLETFRLEEPGEGPPPAPRGGLLGPLFLVPLGLVLAAVLLYGFMTWMMAEDRGPVEYLDDLVAGGVNERNQAFYGLLTSMQELESDGRLAELPEDFDRRLAAVFDQTGPEDARVRTALALCLTMMHSDLALDRVLRMIEEARTGGGEVEPSTPLESLGLVEIQHLNPLTNGILCLGRLGDPGGLPVLGELLEDPDRGLRAASAWALGAVPGEASRRLLYAALEDADREVRRNAALALARQGDRGGLAVLLGMLNPDSYEGYRDPTSAWEHLGYALFALASLGAEEAEPRVRALLEDDRVPPALLSLAMRWLDRDPKAGWGAAEGLPAAGS